MEIIFFIVSFVIGIFIIYAAVKFAVWVSNFTQDYFSSLFKWRGEGLKAIKKINGEDKRVKVVRVKEKR